MNELIQVLVPFEQTFIPFRHRTSRREVLWGVHRIEVRTIASRNAPIAFRVAPVEAYHEDCASARVVRNFEGRYWWPLLDADGPASAVEFVSEAAEGIPRALTALRCPLNFPLQGRGRRPSLDDLQSEFPKCRLVSSTFDAQADKVNHGAVAIVFCDDKVLVAAGPPVYDAIQRYKASESEILAGPSSLDPAPADGYRLPGPDLFDRSSSAEDGFAFGHEELNRLQDLLAERKKSTQLFSRIEPLLHPRSARARLRNGFGAERHPTPHGTTDGSAATSPPLRRPETPTRASTVCATAGRWRSSWPSTGPSRTSCRAR